LRNDVNFIRFDLVREEIVKPVFLKVVKNPHVYSAEGGDVWSGRTQYNPVTRLHRIIRIAGNSEVATIAKNIIEVSCYDSVETKEKEAVCGYAVELRAGGGPLGRPQLLCLYVLTETILFINETYEPKRFGVMAADAPVQLVYPRRRVTT